MSAEYFYVLGIIFFTFAACFVLINLRYVVTGNEFRGTCATNNPMLKAKVGDCTVCGKSGDDPCAMPEVKK